MLINYTSSSAVLLGHVKGPVCDIISEPGVAGKTLGEERIMAVVGGAILHQPAETGEKYSLQ